MVNSFSSRSIRAWPSTHTSIVAGRDPTDAAHNGLLASASDFVDSGQEEHVGCNGEPLVRGVDTTEWTPDRGRALAKSDFRN